MAHVVGDIRKTPGRQQQPVVQGVFGIHLRKVGRIGPQQVVMSGIHGISHGQQHAVAHLVTQQGQLARRLLHGFKNIL